MSLLVLLLISKIWCGPNTFLIIVMLQYYKGTLVFIFSATIVLCIPRFQIVKHRKGKGHKSFSPPFKRSVNFSFVYLKCKEFKDNRRPKEVFPWLDFSNNNCSQGLVRHLVRLHDARSPTSRQQQQPI